MAPEEASGLRAAAARITAGGWGRPRDYPRRVTENLDLASDYSPTREQWLAAVDKVLKGKDFDRVLVSTTLDDVRIEPLYTADDVATTHDESGFPGSDPLTRGAQPAPRTDGQWDIRSRVTHPDPAVANAQILEDLANGATSVDLQLDLGGGSGISIRSPQDLARVLDGVVLDAAPVSLRAGAHAAVVAGWYRELLAERGVHGAEPSGCLGIDPVGTLVTDGEVAMDALMAAGLDVANTPRLRTFRASGAPASDAGASEAQEIGYMLSVALLYLRALIDAGVDNPASRITLEVTADVDVFATVAKLRALRHCWATVLEHMGQPLDYHAHRGRVRRPLADRGRSVGQHPARDRCHAGRGGGRRGIGDDRPVRLRIGAARRPRPAIGPQHAAAAAGRVRHRARARPGGRQLVHRDPSPTTSPQPPGSSSSGSRPPTALWTPPTRSAPTSPWWLPAATRTSPLASDRSPE